MRSNIIVMVRTCRRCDFIVVGPALCTSNYYLYCVFLIGSSMCLLIGVFLSYIIGSNRDQDMLSTEQGGRITSL